LIKLQEKNLKENGKSVENIRFIDILKTAKRLAQRDTSLDRKFLRK